MYDGHDENAHKVGKWCGDRIPREYTTLSNEVLVVFHTDSSYGLEGFRLKYETSINYGWSRDYLKKTTSTIWIRCFLVFQVCGGRFDAENSTITSPRFPNNYEDNKYCLYDIEAPLGKAIVLNFTDFDLENDCNFDSLTIYDGIDANSTKIGTFCGNKKPSDAISTQNHMHLIFKTDSTRTATGFRATYSYIDAGKCLRSFMYRLFKMQPKAIRNNDILNDRMRRSYQEAEH